MKVLRKWLKSLREKNKLSQANIAEKLGITQNYYSMIESRERQKDLDLSIAIKLAEIFNISMDYIAEQEKKIHESEK